MSEGERRHETCRYGRLTPAWKGPGGGSWAATTMPLCMWMPPEDSPPAVHRAWGGDVEFDRDCAICKSYDPL